MNKSLRCSLLPIRTPHFFIRSLSLQYSSALRFSYKDGLLALVPTFTQIGFHKLDISNHTFAPIPKLSYTIFSIGMSRLEALVATSSATDKSVEVCCLESTFI